MTFRKSLKADADLLDIYVYGAIEFGRDQAETYFASLETTMELLASSPLIGIEKRGFGRPLRIHPHGRHNIIYAVESDHILILRILHDSMFAELHLS